MPTSERSRRYDGSDVESGSLSSAERSSGSPPDSSAQSSFSSSSGSSSLVLLTGSFSCHGLPPPASSPRCPGVRLGLLLLFSCKPFTMFSMDLSSPAELGVVEMRAPPPVGVGESVGGLGGGDLGLRVLLPGVTPPWSPRGVGGIRGLGPG